MTDAFVVRPATPLDAEACAAIYAPYVEDTTITFEIDPPSATEMAGRITEASKTHAWLVLEVAAGGRPNHEVGGVDEVGAADDLAEVGEVGERKVVGYAYGSQFKARAAYRWSCEVSVYLERGRMRTGGGRALYAALLARLAERGYRTAVAGMTLPNDASVGLHRAMGFEPVGTYRRVGWKQGAWHDVAWVQRSLTRGCETSAETNTETGDSASGPDVVEPPAELH